MIDDFRLETLQAHRKVMSLLGLRVRQPLTAIAGNDIAVLIEGGVATVSDKSQQFASQELAIRAGDTLAASSEGYSAIVAYYNPAVDGIFIVSVDGAEALSSAGAAEVTDAEIEAVLPSASCSYTVLSMVKATTSAGSVVELAFDERARSFGVPVDGKETAAGYHQDPVRNAGVWKHHSVEAFTIDAADIANGDLLTDKPLPMIYGRIASWRVVVEKAVTTIGKTATLNLELGTTNVTDTATVFPGTRPLGQVTSLTAPAASAGDFAPGQTYSIEAATVTTFIEGRFTIEVVIEERVM